MDFTNYKSWHIPRASLSSASNSGQSSTDSTRRGSANALRTHRSNRNEGPLSLPSSTSSSASSINAKTRHKFDRETHSKNLEKLHRGWRSSQGSSSDGVNSLHSASSLLLSVANLENFTKLQASQSQSIKHGHEWIKKPETNASGAQQSQNHSVLDIHENVAIHQERKAKDFDQVSIASSTHFTVVNGFGRANIKPKSNSLCRQGRQITILIVTMSVLFMIGIIGAVYLMDRRARSMPAYHQ